MKHVATAVGGLFAALAACASTNSVPDESPPQGTPAVAAARVITPVDPDARFWYDERLPLGHPSADSLRNDNGSPRITRPELYDTFWREVSPSLRSWASDPRIRINPNFAAALAAKESGFDPIATSAVPAYGIAQMTHAADADLLLISRDAPAWRWMYDEVRRWPRHPAVHDSLAQKGRIDSLVHAGVITRRNEYLFEPLQSVRGSLFWLRLLAHTWTEDEWPGHYGTMARSKLAAGRPISERDLLALVTVSYNQGSEYVADLVQRHGRDWTAHLNAESADYLERIATYTSIFQRAGAR